MPKVLIIDDVDFARATIRHILEREDYEIIEAENGREALKQIERQRPDLVLLDILMPEMEGLETLRAIARFDPLIPVVAMTGALNAPFLKAALRLGATKGLYKPFNRDALLQTITEVLHTPADSSDSNPQ